MNRGIRLLVIDGDPGTAGVLRATFAGVSVETAATGAEGLALALEDRFDLVVLDVSLEGVDGLEVCRRLRAADRTRDMPVFFLSSRADEQDVLAGFDAGADGFLAKPSRSLELRARLKAVLRRAGATAWTQRRYVAGPLTVDEERHEVWLRGAPLRLTLFEFRLLSALAAAPGRVFPRDRLIEALSGSESESLERTVDVHVRALRKKLGADAGLVVTVAGIGYKLCAGQKNEAGSLTP